ncbi:MAG TPA: PA2169 family four-helix-bundle protein [Hymenobacter sp.]
MSQSTTSPTPTAGLLGKAQQWLRQGSMSDMLGKVPSSIKGLSTTQKVVGGTVLALGVGYLATRKSGKSATSSSDAASTIQELLYFVNDRIEGYKRAVAESKDPELRGYYKQLVSQSQQFSTDLNTFLTREGGEREESTTFKGKFYRAWMDAKAAITGADEKAILGSNVYGEEWAIKAYQDALKDQTLTGAVRQAVQRQYFLSQKTYKHLKNLAAKA